MPDYVTGNTDFTDSQSATPAPETDSATASSPDPVQEAIKADEEKYGYGERTCMQCGKRFIAMHFAQICCTEECRRERRRHSSRISQSRHLAKLHNKIHQLETQLEIANGIIDGLKTELASLRPVTEQLPQASTDNPTGVVNP